MPDVDPLENPVGFWVLFAIMLAIVILLAVGALWWVRVLYRSARDHQDPAEVAAVKKADAVEANQRRLDEQLAQLRARKASQPPRPPSTPAPPSAPVSPSDPPE